MVKYAIIIVAIALIGFGAMPLAKAVFGKGPNEATRLVDATNRTNNKADSLNDSFTDVIPPAPPAQNSNITKHPGPPPFNSLPGPGPGPNTTNTSQPTGPSLNEPTPTPDKYEPYRTAPQHAVRDALEYLAQLQTELDPSPTEYINAVQQLQRAWNPRYKRAVDEYIRFAYRIDHSDAMAVEYFKVQENLTAHISNPQDRRRAQEIDAAEREVYMDWRDQAFATLGQAKSIMSDLDDMNIIITKQSLSAHFAALYEDFQSIPPAITLLHKELAKFREESNRIQRTFGVNRNK